MVGGKITIRHLANGNQPCHVLVAKFVVVVKSDEYESEKKSKSKQTDTHQQCVPDEKSSPVFRMFDHRFLLASERRKINIIRTAVACTTNAVHNNRTTHRGLWPVCRSRGSWSHAMLCYSPHFRAEPWPFER